MRAKIRIKFIKIKGLKLSDSLETDDLIESTEKTINKLCGAIQHHFKDNKIEVKIEGEVERF
jgi:hypothetical protein